MTLTLIQGHNGSAAEGKKQRRIISTSKQVIISMKLAEYDGRRDIFVLHDLDCYFQNVFISLDHASCCVLFVSCWWCVFVLLCFSVVQIQIQIQM